jgi:hypothetical protein
MAARETKTEATTGPRRLLGYYTHAGVEVGLEQYGVLSHLRELGYQDVELHIDHAEPGDRLRVTAEVDGVLALRQPGSTLKPFLYAQAIAERRLTAASLVHDSPAHIASAGGQYIPQNYDRQFKGWVSARTALAAPALAQASRSSAFSSCGRTGATLRG